MMRHATMSPKLQVAAIVQEVRPFTHPKHVSIQQEIEKGGMVVDDKYLYSKDDLYKNIALYKY